MEDIPSYSDLYKLAFKLALKNGAPYFESQYHNENPLNSISCVQCCAYNFQSDEQTDKDFYNKLNFVDGAHFDSLGSMQVVSLNLPRAAYMTMDWQRIDDEPRSLETNFNKSVIYLKILIDKCVEIFKIKQKAISNQASPFMRQTPIDPNDPSKRAPPYCNMDKLSYVIGLVGLNEYVQIMTGKQLHESLESLNLGLKLVGQLNLYCGKVSHANGLTISLSRTPAETTAQRFAVSDLLHDLHHPNETWNSKDYIKGNISKAIVDLTNDIKDVPIEYSNGTHCAVDAPISIQEKARIEGKFFEILKGGNIFHIWLGDVSPFYTLDSVVDENCKRVPVEINDQDVETLMEFGLNLAKNTPINYFAFSKDLTTCKMCNWVGCGLQDTCLKCGSPNVDHMARITGYMSTVSQWNEAKKQELKDRKRYKLEGING